MDWIDSNDANQEVWARNYLVKKSSNIGLSSLGHDAACQYDGQNDALEFLMAISEDKNKTESVIALLSMMKRAWTQHLSRQKKKTKNIRITERQSKELKNLAAKAGLTQERLLNKLIHNAGEITLTKEAKWKETKNFLNNRVSELKKEVTCLKSKVEEQNETINKQENDITSLQTTSAIQKNIVLGDSDK